MAEDASLEDVIAAVNEISRLRDLVSRQRSAIDAIADRLQALERRVDAMSPGAAPP